MVKNIFYYVNFSFQLVTPKFPVVVKIGHAHAGMGKVSVTLYFIFTIVFATIAYVILIDYCYLDLFAAYL